VKRLLLLRHAKAIPGDARTDDHERALNARGQQDAPLMGAEMHHRLYTPDLALCSTARRTIETWARIAAEFDAPPKAEFLDALYLAAPKAILKLVHSADDQAETLLVVGHNPGLEDCALVLARKHGSDSERANLNGLRHKFPTCALAVLDFDLKNWRDIEPGSGALTDFIRPTDLKGE
jgi:phosphohistidine phosphatase